MKVDPSKDWELMEHPVQTMRPLFIHWISRAADDIANHPEEKVERWEVLKNTTVARCAARVYCSVALALLLRVQLSVLAGQGRGRFNHACCVGSPHFLKYRVTTVTRGW